MTPIAMAVTFNELSVFCTCLGEGLGEGEEGREFGCDEVFWMQQEARSESFCTNFPLRHPGQVP